MYFNDDMHRCVGTDINMSNCVTTYYWGNIIFQYRIKQNCWIFPLKCIVKTDKLYFYA